MKLIQFNNRCVGIIENEKDALPKREIKGQHPCYIWIDSGEIFEVVAEKKPSYEGVTPCIFLIDGVRVQGWNTYWTEKTKDQEKDWYTISD